MTAIMTQGAGRGTFARGIHPEEYKHYAEGAAIEVLPTPAEVRIPLLQHLGAPCQGVVATKAPVKVGDLIGEPGGFVSAPVHASVDGVAGRPGAVTLPNGRHVTAIPVKADAEQALTGRALFDAFYGGDWPGEGELKGYEPQAIADVALQSGLTGLGGATFPTHIKLKRNPEKPIDTLLINGCECEPFLTADYRLMLEAASCVVTGALLAQQATGAKDLILCVEDNKRDAAEALAKAAEGTSAKVLIVRTKYPQGGEKQLIIAALNRVVPMGGLPLDVGVVVMNVGTAAALAGAVARQRPLTHRIVTVTGGGVAKPKNLLAPIGASYNDLIAFCGGMTDQAARVISGGPMMGFTVGNLNSPITKGTSGITIMTGAEVAKASETACVRCGRCVDVCPLNLVPSKLAMASRMENLDVARQYHILACMECGCCAYACPASLPLVQLMRMGKALVNRADRG